MSTRKKIILVLAGLAILGALAAALTPSPVPVSTVQVEKGYFAEYVEDEGYTRLKTTYVMSAPVQGYLHRVDLEPGDGVQAGEVLFSMEALPAPGLDLRAQEQARENLRAARARLESARAEHENARIQMDYAAREVRRHEELFAHNVISASVMDKMHNEQMRATAAKKAARSAMEAALFEKENARAVLDITQGARLGREQGLKIRSPVSGMVLNRMHYQEGTVPAGVEILEIGDLDELEVRVDLLSMDAVRVRPGMRVELERWGGEKPLAGRVRRVEPAGFTKISALGVEEQRVPVLVEITSPRQDWEQLGKEYRVEARFILWEGLEVMSVPSSALFRENGKWQLFVLQEGRAMVRRVETGRRSGLRTQVVQGLEPGEKVITHPGDQVRDGVRVDIGQ
ncbi:efflux transporter, RND family, MFP subunit [Desulfonatronospira thiodismutans ASO3-1]|uniref:Efflux transporter, RND family, MFP subunit n=1 Tax=Desulfonatronospira thiodismutans ASO3-1 TaxID=555779 RepID=D6SP17_9BACT|nr:efflux RND transporter periplasmic adaptor subunit [Desulfonatronospira thiodismutans]EFI34493.1 efflux transporter, RND family, MFP subunit [Desulfonatronospira thiodismutans ASO3-1]